MKWFSKGVYAWVVKAFVYLTVAVLVAIAIGVAISSSTWQKPIRFNNKLTQFDSQLLRFEYPSSWSAETYQDGSSFSNAIVFLSNKTIHTPCVRHNNAVGYSVTCHAPLSRLGYDGVLVEWSSNGFPGRTLAKQSGQPISVSGHPGKESVVPEQFWVRGTPQYITVVIARTTAWNFYEANVSLSGPDLARERSEVQAMIASSKILQP